MRLFRAASIVLVVLASSPRRSAAQAAAPAPAVDTITIPAGTLVEFRFDEKVRARKSSAGEKVPAAVSSAVVIEGVQVVKPGADVVVVVTDARRKKAGYFRTAEGYLALEVVSTSAADGSQLQLESVTPIEVGTKDKKFTWTAHNANVKADDTFLAKVTRDTVVKRM